MPDRDPSWTPFPTRRSSVWLLPPLLLAACAVLPPAENDVEMGREVNAQVVQQIGIVGDTDRTAYLERVGQRLVGELDDSRFQFSFKIVDQIEPNAFAAPGGFIFVSRGLLALTEGEDELAGVVGHEIIHVTRRHTAQQMSQARVPSLLTLPGRVVGSVLSEDLGNLINSPIDRVGAVYLASYGRDQESESDRLGLELSAGAGYAPEALADILGRLEQAVELQTGRHHEQSFFDSHPSTPDRIENIHAWAEQATPGVREPFVPGRDEYLRGLDGLMLGENPAKGIFQERKFLHPELGFTMVFPGGWKTMNAPVAVGAVAPDEEGVIFVGVQSGETDPVQAARAFIDRIYNEHRLDPDRSEPVMLGDWPAYHLEYDDVSSSPPMNLHLLWVDRDGVQFQLIAMAPERLRPVLRETVLSMKSITEEERDSIEVVRLRLAEAKEGESLEQFCRRTGNEYGPEETAVLNGLPAGAALAEKRLLKIGRKEPYSGNP